MSPQPINTTMSQQDERKYAPVWAVLFAGATTLTKSLGTRYILKKKWTFQWSDVGAALVGAALGYGFFRMQYGNKDESSVLTR